MYQIYCLRTVFNAFRHTLHFWENSGSLDTKVKMAQVQIPGSGSEGRREKLGWRFQRRRARYLRRSHACMRHEHASAWLLLMLTSTQHQHQDIAALHPSPEPDPLPTRCTLSIKYSKVCADSCCCRCFHVVVFTLPSCV